MKFPPAEAGRFARCRAGRYAVEINVSLLCPQHQAAAITAPNRRGGPRPLSGMNIRDRIAA